MDKMKSIIYPVKGDKVASKPISEQTFDVPPKRAQQLLLQLISLAKTTEYKKYIHIVKLNEEQIYINEAL